MIADTSVSSTPSNFCNSTKQTETRTTDEELQGDVVFWYGASYGFVRPDSGSGDVFFHISELQPGQLVKRGDRISFNLASDIKNPAKPRAVQVRVQVR